MNEPAYDVFISYASEDVGCAEFVAAQLSHAGFRVWFDRHRLSPGCDWYAEIEDARQASLIVVPILTPRWRESTWTRYETYAHDAVVPLLCEGELLAVATPPILRHQACKISWPAGDGDEIPALLAVLRGRIEQLASANRERLVTVASLRYVRNRFFVGREGNLNDLLERLWAVPTGTASDARLVVICALGGVGKTSLANEFAQRFWRLYRQIFWVDCRLGLEAEFARIASAIVDARVLAEMNMSQRAAHAREVLNDAHVRDKRLLVLDNVDTENTLLVRDADGNAAGSWVPVSGSCHTVITSRYTAWSSKVQCLPLGLLQVADAEHLLAARRGTTLGSLSAGERGACARLANRLGYLPLALEVAAAFMVGEGSGFGFHSYLEFYERSQLLALQEHAFGSTDYPASLYTTWRVTIDRLSPHARALLRVCGFWGEAPIPMRAFDAEHVLGLVGTRDAVRDDLTSGGNVDACRTWKRELLGYSLATHGPGLSGAGETIVVHNILQAVERHATRANERPQWRTAARESLSRLMNRLEDVRGATAGSPGTGAVEESLEVLESHVEELARVESADALEASMRLLSDYCSAHYRLGNAARARGIQMRAFSSRDRSDDRLVHAVRSGASAAVARAAQHDETFETLQLGAPRFHKVRQWIRDNADVSSSRWSLWMSELHRSSGGFREASAWAARAKRATNATRTDLEAAQLQRVICVWDGLEARRDSSLCVQRRRRIAEYVSNLVCSDELIALDARLSYGIWQTELAPTAEHTIDSLRGVVQRAGLLGEHRTATFARNNLACSLVDRAAETNSRPKMDEAIRMFLEVLSERTTLRHEHGLAWTTYRLVKWNREWKVEDEAVTEVANSLLSSLKSRGVALPAQRYHEIRARIDHQHWARWSSVEELVHQLRRRCEAALA